MSLSLGCIGMNVHHGTHWVCKKLHWAAIRCGCLNVSGKHLQWFMRIDDERRCPFKMPRTTIVTQLVVRCLFQL